jgi:hypothetical protein
MALLALLTVCNQTYSFDGNSEQPGSRVPSEQIPVIQLRPGSAAAAPGSPALDAERHSAKALILTIEFAPFREDAPVGSGTATRNDWLNDQGKYAALQKIPASRTLLPNLFDKAKADKDVSVKGKLLLNDDEEEITDKIDGAGVSIRFNTD